MGMDIRLARIDDRLIHGQVATAWSLTETKLVIIRFPIEKLIPPILTE